MLGRATRLKNKNNRACLRLWAGFGSGLGFEPEKIGQRKPDQPQPTRLQKLPAWQPEMPGLIAIFKADQWAIWHDD
jgi:hypothetical protein